MKILTTLLAIVVSIFFAGSSFSGESSALMKALTSPQMGMYAGDMEQFSGGAWVIFAQPRDGASTERNVEALNTLYLLSNQSTESVELILTFEMDKINSKLPLLGYRLDFDMYVGVERFDPTELPPIDFQLAWKLVKKAFGEDFPSAEPNRLTLASVAVFYELETELAFVSFNVKLVDDDSEFCWEYIYDPRLITAFKSPFIPPCWFDMDYIDDPCLVHGDRTTCVNVKPDPM